jgi:hypothetical protein
MTTMLQGRTLKSALGLTALLTAALGAGCGDDDPGAAPPTGPTGGTGGESSQGGNGPGPGMAMIRVVHASPDAPGVDIYAEGMDEPLLTALEYTDTSGYLEVPAGAYNIQLRAAPSTSADPVAYSTGEIDLAEGDITTAIAAGLLASTESADRFRVLALTEDFAAAGTGNAVARIVHASADAPTVGIDLHDDDASSPEISGIDRFTDSGESGVVLTAGEPLQIGISAGGQRVTAFTTPALPEGASLFVIATGLTGKLARESDGFGLLAVGPDGTVGFIRQNPVVYALHASPDAPAVDAFAGDAELIDDLSFGELSGALQVPPGDYTLDFFGATAGSEKPGGPPAVSASTGSLEPGQRYLTIATGFLGGGANAFMLDSYAEGFVLDDTEGARVRVVHSSPDAPAVDIGILNVENVVNPVLAANVVFPSASGAEGLAAGVGTIPLGVTPAGANETVVASFHVTTAPGVRAFGVAAGALDPSSGASFRLLVVDTAVSPWSVGTVHPQP